MRRLVALAAVFAASAVAVQAAELPVAVADGAAWTIESRRVREDQRKEGPRRVESTSRYAATYREGGDKRRLLLKPLGGSFLGDLPAGVKAEDFQMPLELEVDETLLPVRLVNWPQVRELVYKMLAGQDPKVVAGMRSLFDPMPDTQAAAMFLPQFAYLGMGQGLALEPGKPLPYEDSLPNPLGGPPIVAQASFLLEGDPAPSGEAVVVWTQALEPQSMAASMKVSMKVLLERMKVDADAAKMDATLKEARMSRDSRCRFRIDVKSGLATHTECASAIVISALGDQSRRTDTWTITQTLPEKR